MSANTILYWLILINLANYIERWMAASLMTSVKQELGLNHTYAGLILSAFMFGYFLASPIFGILSDRISRTRLISVGTIFWGIASTVFALASSAWQLVALRCFIGVGESTQASSSQPMVMDLFNQKDRIRAVTWLSATIPLGSALGYVLGGVFADTIGWRMAFLVVGFFGIGFGLIGLFFKDPRRLDPDRQSLNSNQIFNDIKSLFGQRRFINLVFGYTAFTFVIGALAGWMPHYLVSHRGFDTVKAGTLFGGVTALTGTIGTLFGGWIYSRLSRPKLFFGVTHVIGLILCILSFQILRTDLFFVTLGFAELFLFATQAPVNLLILESVPQWLRGVAVAFCLFTIHILGDFISPTIVGIFADLFDLEKALMVLPIILFLGLGFYLKALRQPSQAKAP
ncbi:MAG: MFS transporter [Oligoflexia bacterium]|nr:MFS transporter [Oligoflexia bacterium]